MRRPLVAAAVALCAALLAPDAARAQDAQVHDILFPVIGEVTYTDTFGAPRGSGRTHEGQDLMGDKMQPLVAADSGVITMLTWPEPSYGYYIELTADDGWTYSYVHINDDTPGTDDGAAERDDVYGPGIDEGVHVERGQLLGYLGDSGNAENTAPHLHFEMRDASGALVNPMASLDAAERADAPVGDAEPSPIPRLAGDDRVATAIAVSVRGWPDGATRAVLAAGDRYAEALPASVLASQQDAPLLLVGPGGLSAALTGELERLGAADVIVVGTVPTSVDDALVSQGRRVRRLGVADDAVATAAAVAREVGGAGGTAVLVNRDRFPDGVSASSLAAGRGWPIILTTTDVVPQVSVDAWRAIGVSRIVLMGGTGVIASNIERFVAERGGCQTGAAGSPCAVERIAGSDRYGTSVAAAERALAEGGRSLDSLLLGTGANYPDSLASGPLAARLDGIALLVDGTGGYGDGATRSYLSANADAVEDVAILGGTGAVTSTADRAIQEALGLR